MRHLLNNFGFSTTELPAASKFEYAFRRECTLVIIFVLLALWYGDNAIEHALLIGSVLLVLIVEFLNSAIEAVVDRIGWEFHPISKRAKDMGSAAVFIALIGMVLIWGIILA